MPTDNGSLLREESSNVGSKGEGTSNFILDVSTSLKFLKECFRTSLGIFLVYFSLSLSYFCGFIFKAR